MQAADMRLLCKLYQATNDLVALSFRKESMRAIRFLSVKYPQTPSFSRQYHSSVALRCSEHAAEAIDLSAGWKSDLESVNSLSTSGSLNDDSNVETFYDPMSGSVRTRAVRYRKGKGSSSEDSDDNSGSNGLSNYEVGGSRVYGDIIGKANKKGKSKAVWVCSSCGNSNGQWWGSCPSCKMAGTMKRFSVGEAESTDGGAKVSGIKVSENIARTWLGQSSTDAGVPIRLSDVNRAISPTDWRIPLSGLFGAEVGRVLGGGVVPGSLILVGGDPGVGKSTLMLQIAAIMAEGHNTGGPAPVLYVSGEESIEQVGNRADRMKIGTTELFLYSSTDIEDMLAKAQPLSPRALVVDSIQTVYLQGVTGSAGSITQVKECTAALLRFAKKTNIPILLAGHVTKSGDIAGPRALEHIVDVVLYMEGDKSSSHRLLRSVKNRFGTTDELGVFEMSQSGLQAVFNPSEIFMSEEQSDSEFLVGLAVAVVMDGSRAFLIEIQALCVSGSFTRQLNGVHGSKAEMIAAVLMKQAGIKLQQDVSIFLDLI
ncbi:OLC1v1014908C5 [Oldenlandia corymbosa var. corymbosa]|uniref:OLC1v1014908C5 n=1 Tax=Oldenlandia corymbosa var. corymbosa TaxID=529605 RepID=A0AAV1E2B2_OLDCO|nr:OLC1v1014908C5 [Oldenlandia corymbosa var. corymbosa]